LNRLLEDRFRRRRRARRVPHTHSNYDANRRFKLRRPHHRYHTHKNLPKRRRTRVQFWLLAPLLRHTQIDDSSHEGSNCNAQTRVPRTTKNASPMRVQIPAPTLSVPTTKADFTPDLSERLSLLQERLTRDKRYIRFYRIHDVHLLQRRKKKK